MGPGLIIVDKLINLQSHADLVRLRGDIEYCSNYKIDIAPTPARRGITLFFSLTLWGARARALRKHLKNAILNVLQGDKEVSLQKRVWKYFKYTTSDNNYR